MHFIFCDGIRIIKEFLHQFIIIFSNCFYQAVLSILLLLPSYLQEQEFHQRSFLLFPYAR